MLKMRAKIGKKKEKRNKYGMTWSVENRYHTFNIAECYTKNAFIDLPKREKKREKKNAHHMRMWEVNIYIVMSSILRIFNGV